MGPAPRRSPDDIRQGGGHGEKRLGLGYHPLGFAHPHVYSHIDPVTLGVVEDVVNGPLGRFGADATLYHMSPDLLPYWEGSSSCHVFLRRRPNAGGHHHHH